MYRFKDLIYITLTAEERNELIVLSEKLIKNPYTLIDFDTNQLQATFSYDSYWVLHDVSFIKGKKVIFTGMSVMAKQKDIITYLQKCRDENDFRTLRILPFENKEKLYYIDEDGNVLLYA
ncbi:hypothetical protein CLV51_106169 [Chitinophaga niastensis]|uniref:Uncharacterized protein n=1 Tax=Chitinophaga niastensis TaxID=536980 RepID=A0A2P8HDL6_CHINA|nr:hypothetical protein [Chitinophaga niastensis]PSL44303.1 hypothetical protein CLV51_106169 [Chitinophaga niastensis]